MSLSFVLLGCELLLVVAFMAITVMCIPKIVVKTAPKDIAEIVMQRPDGPFWKKIVGISMAIIILLAIASIWIFAGYDAYANDMSLGMTFLRFGILTEGYKIFDMICFDWILLTKLNIFQKLFPETIGCKGYESFGFNLKSQLIKLAAFLVLSAVIAGVIYSLKK